MVAYSFKRRFVEPIRSGSKRQTIRSERKRHARIGETLQLYTAMRTKQCALIGTAKCIGVEPITFDFDWNKIAAGARNLTKPHELEAFAKSDGFENWNALREFWEAEHNAITRWSGVLIRWDRFILPERA